MRGIWLRLLRRHRLDRDLEDELRFHLDMLEKDTSDARRRFGNLALLKETSREMFTFGWIEALGQDLRYGLRMLPKTLPQVREGARINSPTGIDVIFSNGSLTSPGGHPIGLMKRNIERGVMKPEDGEEPFTTPSLPSRTSTRSCPSCSPASQFL